MDHGSPSNSRLVSVTFERKLLFLNRAGSMLNIASQWRDPEILIFVLRVCYEKLGHILKPLMPKFRSDLSFRLRDIAENQVPAKLKPIVVEQ